MDMGGVAPEEYHQALIEAITPTRADVLAAKQVALETLADRDVARPRDIEAVIRGREGVPANTGWSGESLDLPRGGDPAVVVRRDVPQLARQRIESAVRRALAELQAEGVILPVDNPDAHAQVRVSSRDMSGGFYAPLVVVAAASAYQLTSPVPDGAAGLLDSDVYTADLVDLARSAGQRCIAEAFRAHRRGLHLAALNMLGAASEAAWYTLGERLRGQSLPLAKALDADTRTATVISAVHDLLGPMKLPGGSRVNLDELRAHATYLRDLRNYGLHPRGRVSDDLEHHFTEHAAALTFMTSHRYFMRLAAIADALPAVTPTADADAEAAGQPPGS